MDSVYHELIIGKKGVMELYRIKPEFMSLIDKLTIALEVYERAVQRAQDEIIKDVFRELTSRTKIFIREISSLFDFDLDKHEVELKDRIRIELDKIRIEINHLILKRKDSDLLKFSIEQENELIDMYDKILAEGKYNDLINTVIKNQLNESKKMLDEINLTLDTYEYSEENQGKDRS